MKKVFYYQFICLMLNSCIENKIEEVVVIGGGLMGSSTAWELSKSGENVLLLEQQDSIYNFGSSYGEARISRSLGVKDDIFSYLQQTSASETKELIDFLNRSSGTDKHSLEDIYTSSPVTYLFYNLPRDSATVLIEDQKLKTDYMPGPVEAMEVFNMIIPDSMSVIREYHRFSGTLNPAVLIRKLHEGIRTKGNKIAYNKKVTSVKREGELYALEVKDLKSGQLKKILGRKVVSAAGPYTGVLLKDIAPYMDDLITPKRLFLAFLKFSKSYYDQLEMEQKEKINSFYPVAEMSPELYYSMIEKFDEDGIPIIKVGGHMLRKEVNDLDSVWQIELSDKEIQWAQNNTARYLKMLNIPIEAQDIDYYSGYSCVYSLTESEVPFVTTLRRADGSADSNFVVVSGMSGIGAKGSLAYGLIASNILLNKTDDEPIYQKTIRALRADRNVKDVVQIPMDYKDGGDPNNLDQIDQQ